MKKSVTYWMLGGFEGETPVAEAAKQAKALGYDAIELSFGAGELTPETDAAQLRALKAQVADAGVELASLITGNYWACSLSSPDAAERDAAVAFTRAYIQAAGELGAGAVLVIPGAVSVPFDPSKPVVPALEVWERAHNAIQAVLPVAEDAGVCIAVENVWNKFLTGPFEYRDFIASFGSPSVKGYFDVGNCLLTGYPEHWIPILGEHIGRVHVKNFTQRNGGGTLDDFSASLLEGSVNWDAVIPALKAAGYDSYLTAEMLVSEKGLPDTELAAQTCRELDQLLSRHG